ncbi:MAG: DJ-1/PfpI family protein [Treponema sp.]|nr:DJ-1/PfpI family protein [Treponema sp.]
MSKIAVLLAPGFEEIEALTPVDYLRRAKQDVILVALPVAGNSGRMVTSSHDVTVQADKTFEEFSAEDLPDAVFVPGGMPGSKNVASFSPALDLIKRMFEKKKLVAAICAAPVVVLAKTGVLAGLRYTCFPGMNENLSEYCGGDDVVAVAMDGAKHCPEEPFVVDGNVITGRAAGAAEQFAMAMVEHLCGKETAAKIKEATVQR